jgi:hypothetical protein
MKSRDGIGRAWQTRMIFRAWASDRQVNWRWPRMLEKTREDWPRREPRPGEGAGRVPVWYRPD